MAKTVGYLVSTYIAKPMKEQTKATVGKKATGGYLSSLTSMETGHAVTWKVPATDRGAFILLFPTRYIMRAPG